MAKKPELTLETALKEFHEECMVVLDNYNRFCPDEQYLFWHTLQWLTGRDLVCLETKEYKAWLGPSIYRKRIPKDLLRWALEEVREHLKQTKLDIEKIAKLKKRNWQALKRD